ncbi:hypothetical protein JOQ06_025532 [Pogonophryne albipinna]|uniref:Ig-like domain-containing protein n=1 Tax=Pogonophryne albipinna TaxID=1090488 RepID=A0AAD6FE14_9TELE|nr:hypothetical protein JOQ06_025532 [Pogonophryne albipinna]
MDIFALLWIVSLAFTGLTEGAGVLPDGLNAAVGRKVMFTTTLTPGTPFKIVLWKFGSTDLFTFSESNLTEPEYEGRITFFMSTGSLELRNLALTDSGGYSVNMFLAGGVSHSGNTKLDVYEPVSNVTITSSSTELVEFNSSVSLSCSSSGSSLSFLWLNSSSEVIGSDRVQITDGNSTLTIVNVTRYDKGTFRCQVSNPVSEVTSAQNLTIYYGPENTSWEISPEKPHQEGSDISLSCSADSRPPAQFTWFLNGSALSATGPELKLMNVQQHQSGSYSCQAFNDKTLRYETSTPASISVLRVEGQDNGAYTRSQEMHYADVRFTKNNNGGTVQMGDQNKPSDYAEIRVNNNPRAAASSLPTYDAHLQCNRRPAPQSETAELYAQVRKN